MSFRHRLRSYRLKDASTNTKITMEDLKYQEILLNNLKKIIPLTCQQREERIQLGCLADMALDMFQVNITFTSKREKNLYILKQQAVLNTLNGLPKVDLLKECPKIMKLRQLHQVTNEEKNQDELLMEMNKIFHPEDEAEAGSSEENFWQPWKN